jgi:hypothetical protein
MRGTRKVEYVMPPTRPRRIVRRLAIVLVLVSILLGGLHWRFTRGVDRRFVGVWRLTTPRSDNIVWEHTPYGRGTAYYLRNGERLLFLRYLWRVHDGFLETSALNENKDFRGWAAREWEILRQKHTDSVYTEQARIVEAGQDRFLLDDLTTKERWTLRRISD